jgi:hypothetical protein
VTSSRPGMHVTAANRAVSFPIARRPIRALDIGEADRAAEDGLRSELAPSIRFISSAQTSHPNGALILGFIAPLPART